MEKRGKMRNKKINKVFPDSKRSQVTIFIIIGLVLIAGFITIYFFKDKLKIGALSSEEDPIYLFVRGCAEQSANSVILLIGMNGGYYYPPELSTDIGVPYYYIEGKTHIPSKEQIEQEISKAVSGEIYGCVRGFEDFPDYQIQEGDVETQTKISDNEITLNVNYPLTITKGDKTAQIKNFNDIEIPVRLGFIYNAVNEITQNQLSNKKYSIDGKIREAYCIECISDTVNKNNLKINIVNGENELVVFNVVDENSKINNQIFEFRFANKYQVE